MGSQSDSINKALPRGVHDALNAATMEILSVLERVGINTTDQIDFHPSTGEIRMTEKTLNAIQSFRRQLDEQEITFDKIMHADSLETSGIYIWKGRKIEQGIIISEGELLDFVPMQIVEGDVEHNGGKEKAVGVFV